MKEAVQELAREKIMSFWLGQTKKDRFWAIFCAVFVVVLILPLVIFWAIYRNSVFPGVRVAGISAGGMKFTNIAHQLSVKSRDFREYEKFSLVHNETASNSGVLLWETAMDELGVEFDPIETAQNVFDFGRNGDVKTNLGNIWAALDSGYNVPNRYTYNREKYEELIDEISLDVDNPGAPANISVLDYEENGSRVKVFLGENGVVIDRDKLLGLFENKLSNLDYGRIELPLIVQNNTIEERQAEQAKKRAEKLLEKNLVIMTSSGGVEKNWKLSGDEIVAFVNLEGGFSLEKIAEYIKELKETVDRPPQNALFKFENGRVLEFAPGLSGLVVDHESSVKAINDGLGLLETSGDTQTKVELVVRAEDPEIKTPDVNNLGIKELIGRGESTYFHSIPGRVFNVAHTAEKLNGVLIPPGETFSFNQTIGDISAATGFKSAYVIKDGRTVLGDGGGVCQDSTTLFRAVMNAGLPITERKGHSYRVGYYEQNSEPGFDATVFSPSVDFKFKNDTPAHILIQAKADSANYSLVIELYGTSDGRVSEISNYQKWGAVPAPPPLYQDDPSLAPGVIRQVDWAASGLKTKFDYKVTRDGETLFEKTFYTTYQPWRAIYLRGI